MLRMLKSSMQIKLSSESCLQDSGYRGRATSPDTLRLRIMTQKRKFEYITVQIATYLYYICTYACAYFTFSGVGQGVRSFFPYDKMKKNNVLFFLFIFLFLYFFICFFDIKLISIFRIRDFFLLMFLFTPQDLE